MTATLGINITGLYPYLAWPLIATGSTILLSVAYIVYNLFLHPLRKVPGPTLWAATQIPYTLGWLSGRMPVAVHALHEKYGDVVRVAPGRLSFAHPDAWHAVRGHRKAGEGEHGKETVFYIMSRENILGAPREQHARYRRVLAHGFSAASLKKQEGLIGGYVDLLMRRLKEKTASSGAKDGGVVVDLAAWFNFATFDVIGDLSFGEPFGCLQESRYHPWIEIIFRGLQQFGMMVAVQWYCPGLLGAMNKLGSAAGKYFGRAMDEQKNYAGGMIRRRLQLETSRPDFVEAMVTAKSDDGRTLTMEEMASNARMLVLAGSETTATALSGTAYFLAKHPEVQRKLAEEVWSSFASESEIDLSSVNKLQYMLAVLDESMRLFPPVPGHMPRTCQPGGDVIFGYHVPEGTGLDIWPWAMNYSSRNFTEPNEFIPERWLVNEYQGRRFNKDRHGSFQPFSVGPRNCIGKNLAYVEMRLILARLIWNYDLVLGDEASGRLLECKSYNLWLKGALNVRLIPMTRE